MHARNLPLAFLLVSWAVASCEASGVFGGLVGGLAVLKGAALVGYAVGRHSRYNRRHYHARPRYHGGHSGGRLYRYGRSVDPDTDDDAEEGTNLLLSTVGQLDPDGCILKLLCLLQTRSESSLTPEEEGLVQMFSNNSETMSSYNAAFVYATDVGTRTRDPAVCERLFPKCSLREDQLSRLLQSVWGCASDFLRDDAKDEDTATPAPERPVVEERPSDEEEPRDQQPPVAEYVDDEELPAIDMMTLINGLPLDNELPRNEEMSMEELLAIMTE
ncbi:uncharacterized protein LOC122263289 [Penaeus japonicus]|uniref:uncharacterized protein LOC122263289 n=1 Tax=Penaeus japonicus TaxID=27405 RepID=UPI001C7179CF|nr:uncharacterized protein LOC122263289 [Penaeus japonicus]